MFCSKEVTPWFYLFCIHRNENNVVSYPYDILKTFCMHAVFRPTLSLNLFFVLYIIDGISFCQVVANDYSSSLNFFIDTQFRRLLPTPHISTYGILRVELLLEQITWCTKYKARLKACHKYSPQNISIV